MPAGQCGAKRASTSRMSRSSPTTASMTAPGAPPTTLTRPPGIASARSAAISCAAPSTAAPPAVRRRPAPRMPRGPRPYARGAPRRHHDTPHPLGRQPRRAQHVAGPVGGRILVGQQLRQQRRPAAALRLVAQVAALQLQREQRDQAGYDRTGGVVRAAGEQQQTAQPPRAQRLHLQLLPGGRAGGAAAQSARGDPFDQVVGLRRRRPLCRARPRRAAGPAGRAPPRPPRWPPSTPPASAAARRRPPRPSAAAGSRTPAAAARAVRRPVRRRPPW